MFSLTNVPFAASELASAWLVTETSAEATGENSVPPKSSIAPTINRSNFFSLLVIFIP